MTDTSSQGNDEPLKGKHAAPKHAAHMAPSSSSAASDAASDESAVGVASDARSAASAAGHMAPSSSAATGDAADETGADAAATAASDAAGAHTARFAAPSPATAPSPAATGAAGVSAGDGRNSASADDAEAAPSGSPRRKAWKTLSVVFALIAVCAVGVLAYQQWQYSQAGQKMAENPEPATTVEAATTSSELPDNPVNFDELRATNDETVAWLYMPNCGINLAIMQSATDDSYYLTHGTDGAESLSGSAYIELANSMDFSDPVTLVYGHDNEGVFKNLHYYEDETFFNDNPEFYIYTPGHILTYTVVSAYKYDDRHILNSFNFGSESVRSEYFSYVMNPDSLVKNVREGVELTADSKIVQFSTCMLNEYHGSSRYLVSGVLTGDQQTK